MEAAVQAVREVEPPLTREEREAIKVLIEGVLRYCRREQAASLGLCWPPPSPGAELVRWQTLMREETDRLAAQRQATGAA